MSQELLVNLKGQFDGISKKYEELSTEVVSTNQTIREAVKVINQLEYISHTLATHVFENQTNANNSNEEQERKDWSKELVDALEGNVVNLRKAVDLLEI